MRNFADVLQEFSALRGRSALLPRSRAATAMPRCRDASRAARPLHVRNSRRRSGAKRLAHNNFRKLIRVNNAATDRVYMISTNTLERF